jgi:hypothetical protein
MHILEFLNRGFPNLPAIGSSIAAAVLVLENSQKTLEGSL